LNAWIAFQFSLIDEEGLSEVVRSGDNAIVAMRMHPCEAALLMDLGLLVPWIP
jgi:hypothetical protein